MSRASRGCSPLQLTRGPLHRRAAHGVRVACHAAGLPKGRAPNATLEAAALNRTLQGQWRHEQASTRAWPMNASSVLVFNAGAHLPAPAAAALRAAAALPAAVAGLASAPRTALPAARRAPVRRRRPLG